jgi:hypothetical protein
MGDNTTTSQGKKKKDATRGGGGGECELVDVRQRCHKRQCRNQLRQMRGKREVELPAGWEVAARLEAVVLIRGWECVCVCVC